MNFACVEYTTKTRKVWVPSVDHPNYLADPVNEIDPTSFAGHTTALNGKHVPLTGVILGQLEGDYLQYVTQKLRRALTGSWGRYSLDYFRDFDVVMAVYDWRRGKEMADFVRRLKAKFPLTVVIGVPTQPFGQLREQWQQPEKMSPLIKFFDNCDVVISIVRSTVPYQQSMTKTPIVYLPQPYPETYASDFWHDFREKDDIIFVAGETSRPDILAGHLAARDIQRKCPNMSIHITETPKSPLNSHLLQETDHKIVPFKPWREYLPYLAHAKVVINTDTWWTRGRVQTDCAAVGTASIGGPSDGQQELFPDLLVRDVEDFENIVSLGSKLLGDNAFYREVTQKAYARLNSYNHDQTAERFRKLVKCVREDKIDEFPKFEWHNDKLLEIPQK